MRDLALLRVVCRARLALVALKALPVKKEAIPNDIGWTARLRPWQD